MPYGLSSKNKKKWRVVSRVLWGGPGSGRPKATRQTPVETGRPGPWGVPWHRVLWAQPEIHCGKRMRAPPFAGAPSQSTIRAQSRVPEWRHFRPAHSNEVRCVSRHPGSCCMPARYLHREEQNHRVGRGAKAPRPTLWRFLEK